MEDRNLVGGTFSVGEREDVATVAWNGGHSSHTQGDCVCGAYPNLKKATTPDYYYSAVIGRLIEAPP